MNIFILSNEPKTTRFLTGAVKTYGEQKYVDVETRVFRRMRDYLLEFEKPDLIFIDDNFEMKPSVENARVVRTKDSKAAIGIQNVFTGSDQGKFTEDLQQGQVASNRNTPPVAVEQQKVETKVVDNAVVDVPASFPGGDAALRQFIAKNTVYPEIAIEQGLQGTVVLRFKVDVDGSVSTVSVKKSLSRECDKAAMDVFRKLPKFTPAKTNGHPVPVWFTMPVKFAIQ